jgi:dTDP-4-amino-4,6-dideoxygalactose transaminase
LSLDSVRRCVGPRTRAVLLVHLYGQLRDMAQWTSFAAEMGIHLVEDCAQAHLASWHGRKAGSFGVAGAYSFYPTKNLGAIGDGGALVCNEPDLAARVARLRNYGQSERYVHPELGMNSRLDELQAALLDVRLEWLQAFTARRRVVAQAYDTGIRHQRVKLLAPAQEGAAHVHHLYVLLCDERQALQRHLEARGVQTLIHYPVPIHRQEPCRLLHRDPQGLPNAESHAARCLSIPCHPQLDDDMVGRIIDAINDWR